jgi:hypothetical protein
VLNQAQWFVLMIMAGTALAAGGTPILMDALFNTPRRHIRREKAMTAEAMRIRLKDEE